MKKTVFITLFMSIVMLLMPLSVLSSQPKALEASKNSSKIEKSDKTVRKEDIFRLYDPETEKITNINAEDYIFGVVAAEMPALYETEALKAQAVAAYTYACFNREKNKDNSYDISADPSVSQCYITEEEAIAKWGEKSGEYKEKIKSAVSEVIGNALTYKGEIILSVYHAISCGVTEDSSNVWGKEYNYLKSVDSGWDKNAENYKSTVNLTSAELKEKLGDKVSLSGEEKNYFGKSTLTDAGYVKKIEICSESLTGADIRKYLDLRSNCFEVSYNEGVFTFEVYGYGHGVGMSQFGANCLAKEGKNYKEILKYYYSGCKIEELN